MFPFGFKDPTHPGVIVSLPKKNKKVIKLAKKVEKQSKIYKRQLSECGNLLNKNKYIIF